MTPPALLDLFCCAGGAGRGYADAGFRVIGVDIEGQPNYPFEFVKGDALTLLPLLLARYRPSALHGSPPCQKYTPLNAYNHKDYPDLVDATRHAFQATGLPYVIENVPQAPLVDPVTLCGAMPELGLTVYRHRGFETNWDLGQPAHPDHVARCVRNGYLPTADRPFMSIHGGKHSRAWQRKAAEVMGMPWVTTIREVCEAIPPAYTRYIGAQLLAVADRAPVLRRAA